MKNINIKFYFDYISPYVWLSWKPLIKIILKQNNELKLINFEPIPILFASLLNYHGQLGPAEIPSKREWLINDISRRSKLNNLNLNTPLFHPFNPLLSLRITTIDMNNEMKLKLIEKLLDSTWSEGKDISNVEVMKDILNGLNLDSNYYIDKANSIEIKEKLKQNTDEAIKSGVFGVPTTIVNDKHLFWGSENDTMNMIELAINDDPRVIVDPAVVEKWLNTKKSAERRK